MKKFVSDVQRELKRYWSDNPLGTIAAGAAAVTAVAKLVDALSAAQSRRAYAKQVKHRTKHASYNYPRSQK